MMEQGNGCPRPTRAIELSKYIEPSSDPVTKVEEMPFAGFCSEVFAGWPDGADQAVGLSIRNSEDGDIYFPEGSDDYVAFNDLFDSFGTTFSFDKGDKIEANFLTNKSNPIFINCVLIIHKALPEDDLGYMRGQL